MALRDVMALFVVEVDQTQLDRVSKRIDSLLGTLRGGLGVVQAFGAAFAAQALMQTADAFTAMNNRIRNVTEGADDFANVQRRLVDVARETYRPVEDITELFQRYKMATSELGTSQEEVIDFTKRLTQATVLTSSSAGETRGALIQLAQGIGTNFQAAGQELRSIQEQAPALAKIIAEAAGGSAGQLLELAKAGKITGRLVVDAVRRSGAELDRQFGERVPMYSENFTRLRTEWTLLVGELNEASGIGRAINQVFLKLSNIIKALTSRVREFARAGKLLQATLAVGSTLLLRWAAGFQLVGANLGSLVGWLLRVGAASRLLLRFLLRFALPVLIVDELITLFRGGDTLIGRFIDKLFGIGKAAEFVDLVKRAVSDLFDSLSADGGIRKIFSDLGEFFALLGKQIWDSLTTSVGRALDWIAEKLKTIPGVGSIIEFAKQSGERTGQLDASTSADARASIGGGGLPTIPLFAPPTLPPGAARTAGGAGTFEDHRDQRVTVNVQGNASPEVARQIGREVRRALPSSQDLSAIGAAMGAVTP